MLKITNPDYFLPTITALVGGKIFTTGANHPHLVRGVCSQTGEKNDYVVKYLGAERMIPSACARELIAICIANEMDYVVPEPVVVNITNEFVETLRGNDAYSLASRSIGYNFGSQYVEGSFQQILKGQKLPEGLYSRVVDLFAFDLFISNADRNHDRPNMLTDGENILIFDHELAFGFTRDIRKNPHPWLILDHDMAWIRNQYLFPVLQGREHNFENFVKKLDLLNADFWSNLESIIPTAWMSDEYTKIRTTLGTIIEHKTEFVQQINTRLQ